MIPAPPFENNLGTDAERTNPPSQGATQVQTFGDNNVELPEELQNAGLALLHKAQEQDLYQRRREVLRDRLNRFYERGMQHVYPDFTAGGFVVGTPGGWVPDGDRELQCGNYIEDYNIFGRALQIIIAKLTENPPGVDFQPDSGNNSVDLQASTAAEAYRLLYDRRNDSKDTLTAIVRMMGVSGRTVTWTRTIADEQRWGTNQQGKPVEAEITTVYGTLENKVPILARSMQDWPYCILSEDPHILMAKKEHPLFAEKITEEGDAGTPDAQFERMARLGALQGNTASFQITDTYDHYAERKICFFRPAMYLDKEFDSEYDGRTLRDWFTQLFPDGCQMTFIGEVYVGSLNKSMDDSLSVDFPYAGDGMSRMAIMDPAVVLQDRFNDDMNLYAEWKDFGAPSTWIRGTKVEIAAVNDQTASPFCFRPALELTGIARDRPLSDMFWREPEPNIPASFMQHTEYLATQLLQFILAIPSAVQGAGMPDQKTASGYQAALVQAMGQLGVIWGAVQRLMANVYRQAALLAAERDPQILVIPSPKGAVTLDTAALGKGHFLAHPDVDSGFPESTMQQRAMLTNIFGMAAQYPQVAEALFESPDNWDFYFKTFGVSEIVIPEAVVRRKQLAEIEELLQQSPIKPTEEEVQAAQDQASMQAQSQHAQATMLHSAGQGAPPPPYQEPQPIDPMSLAKSSITPEMLDYHPWEFEECREFLSNYPKVEQELAKGNPDGIMNVRLHAMEHMQMGIQMAAQQAALNPQPAVAPPKKAGGPPEKKQPPQGDQPQAQPAAA